MADLLLSLDLTPHHHHTLLYLLFPCIAHVMHLLFPYVPRPSLFQRVLENFPARSYFGAAPPAPPSWLSNFQIQIVERGRQAGRQAGRRAGLFPRIQPRPFLNSLSGSPPFGSPPSLPSQNRGGRRLEGGREDASPPPKKTRNPKGEGGRKYHPAGPNRCRRLSAGSVCNLLRAVGRKKPLHV